MKALRYLGYAVSILVLIAMAGAAFIHFDGIPSYTPHPPVLKVQGDSAMIAEGKRLATMVCNNCHMAQNGKLEGKEMLDLPTMFGKVYTANITQHPQFGISTYTDGELAYFLRTGVKRDGQYVPPWMPKFVHLSDYDLNSIIAYLRSDAPELQPSEAVHPKPQPTFLAKFLSHTAFKPLPFPTAPIPEPDKSNKVAFGKYLATGKVECFGCHSASFETMDLMEPEKTVGYFGGGNAMPNLEGEIILTRNLTPDKETGIGNWTEAQFMETVRFGKRPNGQQTRYPMPPYAAMTEEEASAIWAYLQTIPPIKNKIE
ncbi:MAG: c-type cytochrome [Saprospiraceae bacterium]|nr:c-type cytochrome [Saprospiraceae bacterium]